MSQIKDAFLRRLMHNYSRYILFTVVGSSTLLLSFNWTAETSLLSAAGFGVLVELLLSSRKARSQANQNTENLSPQFVSVELQQSND